MIDEREEFYPQKPVLERGERKRHVSITVASIVIFVLTFSFLINDYYLILLLLGALLLHEMGHFLMMKRFKYKDLNLLFIPFIGAMVSGHKKEYSQKEITLMVLAGPLPGILLGGLFLLNNQLVNEPVFLELGVLLIFLNVFNLAPIEPLDGGQIFRTLFIKNQLRYELFQLILNITLSLGVAILGIYINSWIVIIFGLLIGFRVRHQHKMYLIRKEMKEENIESSTNYEALTNQMYAKIKQIVINNTPSLSKLEEFDGTEEYDKMMANQVENALYPPVRMDASFAFKLLVLGLWLMGILLSVYSLYCLDLNSVLHAFQIG